MKPEWKQLAPGVLWCQGCGCVKLTSGTSTKYLVPRREAERRRATKLRAKDYPRLAKLGVEVRQHPDDQRVAYVRWPDVEVALRKHGLSNERFGKLFGVQTCSDLGPYPHDVEAVLERMMSGKKTGTQLLWD